MAELQGSGEEVPFGNTNQSQGEGSGYYIGTVFVEAGEEHVTH